MTKECKMNRVRALLLTAGVAVASWAPAVLATPPDMDAVTFPISTTSIIAAISTAGAAILLLIFPLRVGFSLIRRLASKAMKAV